MLDLSGSNSGPDVAVSSLWSRDSATRRERRPRAQEVTSGWRRGARFQDGGGWVVDRAAEVKAPSQRGRWDRPLPGLAGRGAPQSRECARSRCSDSLGGLRGRRRSARPRGRALPPLARGRGSCGREGSGARRGAASGGSPAEPARWVGSASGARRPLARLDVEPLESGSTVAVVAAVAVEAAFGGPGRVGLPLCCPGSFDPSSPRCVCLSEGRFCRRRHCGLVKIPSDPWLRCFQLRGGGRGGRSKREPEAP